MLTSAAVSTTRRAVRSALAAEDARPDSWQWDGSVPAADFLDAVAHHRVAHLLLAHADRHWYDAEVRSALEELTAAGRLAAMAAIHGARAVDQRLDGIDHLFLKGAALAVQTTGDPTGRGAGDIDVLVRPGDVGRAVDALTAHGWRARAGYTVNQASWAWRHQLRATNELVLDGALGSVDLHWRLDPTYAGLPDFDTLWRRHVRVDVGPATVPTLSLPDAFAHSLRHAAKDRWDSLRSLIDIHRLAKDPDNWPERCDRLARMSLSVTALTVGLSPTTPSFKPSSAGLAQALHNQARDARVTRYLGDNSIRYAAYMLRSSRAPRDLLTTASVVALPPVLLADLDEPRGVRALGTAGVVRLRNTVEYLRGRRR